jgi:hypothetical protein
MPQHQFFTYLLVTGSMQSVSFVHGVPKGAGFRTGLGGFFGLGFGGLAMQSKAAAGYRNSTSTSIYLPVFIS